MATGILVIGESGAGKTTSCRKLDPKTTFIIDCDKKGLAWRGWKKSYSMEKSYSYSQTTQQKTTYHGNN